MEGGSHSWVECNEEILIGHYLLIPLIHASFDPASELLTDDLVNDVDHKLLWELEDLLFFREILENFG